MKIEFKYYTHVGRVLKRGNEDCTRSNEKYIDRRSNFVTTDKNNHEWIVKFLVSIAYLYLKFDEIQNDYLTQTLAFLAGVELKKVTPAWEDKLFHLF